MRQRLPVARLPTRLTGLTPEVRSIPDRSFRDPGDGRGEGCAGRGRPCDSCGQPRAYDEDCPWRACPHDSQCERPKCAALQDHGLRLSICDRRLGSACQSLPTARAPDHPAKPLARGAVDELRDRLQIDQRDHGEIGRQNDQLDQSRLNTPSQILDLPPAHPPRVITNLVLRATLATIPPSEILPKESPKDPFGHQGCGRWRTGLGAARPSYPIMLPRAGHRPSHRPQAGHALSTSPLLPGAHLHETLSRRQLVSCA